MNNAETHTSAEYKKVREAFAQLDTQDKTAFVLEATFGTIGSALNETGQRLADAVEQVMREDFWRNFGRTAEEAAQDAAEAAEEAADETAAAAARARRASTRKGKTDANDDV